MEPSVLTSTKKALGLDASDEAFDPEILMHINSILATLNQIGVGPENGIQIEDAAATWDDLLGSDPRLNNVKSYMYTKVRMLFNPPATSFAIAALEAQTKEFEYRIYTASEVAQWQ